MNLIAIDPGYAKAGRGCACAMFVDDALVAVWFDRPTDARCPALARLDEVVWEIPQVDARTRVSTPHVVQLAAVGGTLAGLYAGAHGAKVVPVTPSKWKGSLPKPVCHGRIWAKLTLDERAILGGAATLAKIDEAKRKGALARWAKAGGDYYPASWLTHNLLDAVGIGIWRLGR